MGQVVHHMGQAVYHMGQAVHIRGVAIQSQHLICHLNNLDHTVHQIQRD
jgi:hypothetical protein